MKNDGFSLLEVIISIAALSLMSVFILQMFIVSSNVNKRARDTDMALAESISAIEAFKMQSNIDDYKHYLSSAGEIIEVSSSNDIEAFRYYDKDWNIIYSDASLMPQDTRYLLEIQVSPDKEHYASHTGSNIFGDIYLTSVEIVEVLTMEKGRTLVSLQTKKYFASDVSQ